MSLLSIIQDAASDLGLRQPALVVGSDDLTTQILLRMAQQGARSLVTYHDWQKLITVKSFTTVATEAQTSSIANDFDRFLYNPEIWNTSLNLRYIGPTPQRAWRQLSAGVSGGVIGYWRMMGGTLHILPTPTAGQTVTYEYISTNHCTDSAGTTDQSSFEDDADLFKLGDDLLKLEVIWRFRASRGFAAYAEDLETCEREKEKAAARDRGTGRIRPSSSQNLDWPPPPVFDGSV